MIQCNDCGRESGQVHYGIRCSGCLTEHAQRTIQALTRRGVASNSPPYMFALALLKEGTSSRVCDCFNLMRRANMYGAPNYLDLQRVFESAQTVIK